MEAFHPDIIKQAESLPAAQQVRLACELHSILGLRMPIRYLIGLVSDAYILSTYHFKELCHEFNGIESMMELVGIYKQRKDSDEFWVQWQRKCHPHPWLWNKDEDERAVIVITGGEQLAVVSVPERVGFGMVLTMQPLSSVVCRLVQMQSTLLQCVTDPSVLGAAWKESPLNLKHKFVEFRLKPVELVMMAGEVDLFSASLDPSVDKGFRIDVTMKLLKSSGCLGFRVKLGPETSMRLVQGANEDPSEVTSQLSTTDGTAGVRKTPLRKVAFVIWNCKGYDHAQFHVGLREIVAKFHPSVLLVTNTRAHCKGRKEKIDPKPFKSFHVLEPVLGCGGAIIMWNADEVFLCYEMLNYVAFTAEVLTSPNQCIHLL